MDRISNASLRTVCLLTFLTVSLSPACSLAVALDPEVRAELTASKLVSPGLIEALEHQERVVAKIYVTTSRTPDEGLRQSSEGAPVDPGILEVAQAILPGNLSLHPYIFVEELQGTVDARIVQGLLDKPQIVSIDLAETALPEVERAAAKATCFPTSTRACVQGGRFSLEVYFGSSFTPAVVAASSSESALFWFYSSTNWEVVAKVINGCSINNHYWIFAAGATGTNYQLNVFDWATGRSVGYNGAALCPIADTGQPGLPGFPC